MTSIYIPIANSIRAGGSGF